jgi:Secretion system C-terminal sorting domain
MKNLYIFLLLFVGVVGFGQTIPGVSIKLSPNGLLENIFDKSGNKYTLSDIKAGQDKMINNTLSKSTVLCNSGIFDLYFETGSGMESTTNVTERQRRDVVCQVFNDLSNFIVSPLQNAGNTTRVKIWVRNITNISGVPSNALGLATAFYNLPQNLTTGFGGIADNEVWKTITAGKDSYINVTYPLISTNSTPNPSGNFYHGMMAFNFNSFIWNTNLAINASVGQYDLYSVVLHEVTHALGFASLMDANGQSVFGAGFNYFSRYDKFLKNNAGTQSLITNSTACSSMYNYNFNTSLPVATLHPSTSCLTDQTTCANAVKFVGTSTVPVYTTNCFEPGSSLSHFEDLCVAPNVNNGYFTMSNAIAAGVTKRFLKFQERNALGDIGYKVNTTFGNNTTAFGSFNNYGGAITNGINVAGLNDGIATNSIFTYIGNTNTVILINSSTDTTKRILANDTNATSFECLQDVFSTSTFSATSGTATSNITFTSAVAGLHILRYVPINATGQRGNITYIYVYVNETNNCAIPSACDLIVNGNFEQHLLPPDNFGQVSRACGWAIANYNNPDYFNSDSLLQNFGVPCNNLGAQNDKISGNHGYLGMFFIQTPPDNSNGWYESIRTELVSPLQPNINYQLSFDVSLAEGASEKVVKFQAYLSDVILPITSPYGEISLPNSSSVLTNSTFSTIANGWERINIQIPAKEIAGEKFLYLGGLKNVQFNSANESIENSCNTYNRHSFYEYGSAFYYIDNVSLMPLNGANFDLPTTVCNNVTLLNLTTYLLAAPTDGVFTGNGVVNNSGIYSFNATVAGVGPQIITYTFTNSSGCSVSISDTIIVTNTTGITPIFTQVAPICSGAVLSPLPTTSNNNGITGTWSGPLVNTATTTYTFTPTAGLCATTATMTITVLPANDPACNTNPCLPNLTLNVPETISPIIYKRLNWIETNTNYVTAIAQNITMKAGDYINLKAGTHIKSGSSYLGKIEACTATSKVSFQRFVNPDGIKNDEVSNAMITIYPNPTKENVTIASTNSKIKSIVVSSVDGKTCFLNSNINNEQFLLDASSYQNGIYIITIETIDGKIERQKLVKN